MRRGKDVEKEVGQEDKEKEETEMRREKEEERWQREEKKNKEKYKEDEQEETCMRRTRRMRRCRKVLEGVRNRKWSDFVPVFVRRVNCHAHDLRRLHGAVGDGAPVTLVVAEAAVVEGAPAASEL